MHASCWEEPRLRGNQARDKIERAESRRNEDISARIVQSYICRKRRKKRESLDQSQFRYRKGWYHSDKSIIAKLKKL
ncbi:hypothetical protein BJX96DRAFT_146167 [Aspergillus floccosus]